ncbi:hypothetical protein VN0530_06440 [Helicobacter pylori]
MLFSKDIDFVPVLEAAWEKDFEVFIANIQEDPNFVPPDLRKSCDVRERSVAEILVKLPKVATKVTPPRKRTPTSLLTIHLKTISIRRTNALPPPSGQKSTQFKRVKIAQVGFSNL